MIFFHILKSIDELLYELMTWLLFYPITLWRSVRHPLRTMDYAMTELQKKSADQFRATLSPPIFLLVTVVIAHVVELQAVGDSAIVSNQSGLADLVNDDTSLIVLRIMGFALFPVAMAAIETKLSRLFVNRDTLQRPFYAQCYLAAPFALALSLASTAIRVSNASLQQGGLLLVVAATIVYIGVEAKWFVKATRRRWPIALAGSILGFLICILIIAGMTLLLGGD
ncbi:hypothetical protein [Sphingomonas sp. URHD0057]|uniref:hypothetical protein n=1 Tax=Sphingomonas sp. URHD0057 TaxID=1380389 RepID=UPI000688ADCD|nr:hypothetical protein [Sphingomonas sp. URHD0057]